MPSSKQEFLVQYNPDRQRVICQSKDDCFFGDYPTLARLKVYGASTPASWLMPQLLNLSEFCGCRDKLTIGMIEELADIIAQEWYYLKVSELMLFFYWFKSGRYGRFYGAVDPLVITTSLRDFVADRNEAISKREYEERKARREHSFEGCITREEYLKLKQQANDNN